MEYGYLMRRSSKKRNGFTVLELLVSVAILGTLVATLLPAVMHARELTRLAQCTNNVRQFGLALIQYHDHVRALPRAWSGDGFGSRFAESWGSQILPELGVTTNARTLQGGLGRGLLESYELAADCRLSIFLCPSDIAEPAFELLTGGEPFESGLSTSHATTYQRTSRTRGYLPTANYVAVYGTVEADDFEEASTPNGQTFGDGCIIHDRGVKLAELVRGTSQTLLVGERKMAMVPSTWLGVDLDGEDAACRITGSAITRPNCEPCDECEFSSRHAGGSVFLWADGHVSLVTDSIDTHLYRQSAKRRNDP